MIVLYACNEPQVNGQHVAVNTNMDSEMNFDIDVPDFDIDVDVDMDVWGDHGDYKLKDKQNIHHEYKAESLSLYNLSGEVKVESHNGDKIVVDIEQIISAKNEEDLEKGKSEVKIGADEGNDLMLYTEYPYDTRPHDRYSKNEKPYQPPYALELNYTIKVPKNTIMKLSTVNGGVEVKNVDGKLSVNSVNGDILVEAANYVEKAHTVNGDITVQVDKGQKDGSYNTINGDINFSAPESLSASCKFKSLNGELYTDFENFKKLDDTKKSEENKMGKKRFKLNKLDGIIIGSGDAKINFETLNGDVFIKKAN